jgi:rRNA-processing protein FCF1
MYKMITVNRQFKIDLLKKKGVLERITQEIQILLGEIPDEYLKIDEQHQETLDIINKWLRYASECIDSNVDQKDFVNQVVADEVRKLAEKTMTATKDVGGSIKSIQSESRENITKIGVVIDGIEKSLEISKQVSDEFDKILSISEETSSEVSAIATASEEQSAVSEQINQSTDKLHATIENSNNIIVSVNNSLDEVDENKQKLSHIIETIN